ncbi:hypothetical protein OJF2_60770 [Aquisphaera giovannonii]|uniref:Uncharacterized protein n=1 Tax=Aquisphaera giovannonii TaxID=406548 RepID=A0A5B9WAC8_9BACT|nr:hypothetical protein [Aquisphaera giovannonii]QEH37486.1 hypothetical protein OJF2_60770 [Aquisphaera giovannonii]
MDMSRDRSARSSGAAPGMGKPRTWRLLRVLLGLFLIWMLASIAGRFRVVETGREPIEDYDAFEGWQEYRVTNVLRLSWDGRVYELRRWTQQEKHSPLGD